MYLEDCNEKRVADLIRSDAQFEILLSGLINTSRLSYDNRELDFDDSFIRNFIKATNNAAYIDRVRKLREEGGYDE